MDLLNVQPLLPEPKNTFLDWIIDSPFRFVFILLIIISTIILSGMIIKEWLNNLFVGLGERITRGIRENESDVLVKHGSVISFSDLLVSVKNWGENNE